MFKRLVVPAIVAAAVYVAAPLQAQSQSVSSIEIAPYAGYMMFGDFLTGPLGTRLSSANGAVYGAQLSLGLTKNIALVGNLAHAQPNLQVGIPFLGGISVGQSSIWMYDGGVQLSLPLHENSAMPIVPFVQVGAGAMRYDVNVASLQTQATNFAYNVGAGADIAFGRNVGLRLMAKDYIGKLDMQQATSLDLQSQTAHNWALSAGLKFGF